MSTSHTEVERTFSPEPAAALPDLTGVPGVHAVAPPVTLSLSATYFDTDSLRLAGRGITLRRRSGGEDDGWHVKLPVGTDTKRELHRPLGRALLTVPAAVAAPVQVHVRDEPMVAVATIDTERTVYRLLDADGTVLAEVCDDRVTARRLVEESAEVQWREWEVELVGGGVELLDAVCAALLASGSRPAAITSKLRRALGSAAPRPPAAAPRRRHPRAGALAVETVREQIELLWALDPAVRADAPDAVHRMRVSLRTLRSLLATYRPVLERSATDPLREELRWLGEVLGAARDAEVARAAVLTMLAAEPAETVLGPVRRRVQRSGTARYRAAHRESVAALGSTRWFRLLDALDALLSDPPFTAQATRPAGPVLTRTLAQDWRRLRSRHARAERSTGDPDKHSLDLHEFRKAAKRARYAAEALTPTLGPDARRTGKAAQRLTQVLGARQDVAVVRPFLRGLCSEAHAAGEPTFTYGRLDAQLDAGTDHSDSEVRAAWARADRSKVHGWLRP